MTHHGFLVVLTFAFGLALAREGPAGKDSAPPQRTSLPEPSRKGRISLEEAIAARRSLREYAPDALTLEQISQLLWAAQGITSREGDRAAPSAGALFPLEIYVVLPDAVHHYEPVKHRLARHLQGDLRGALHDAALSQDCVRDAPALFVIAGVHARTASRYGKERARRYVAMEAGHAAENLLLEAVALGLGGVPVGAFDDARVARVLALPEGTDPLYLVPVGRPR